MMQLYTVPLLECKATRQSASFVATADKQSGSGFPLSVFWSILLSMHIYDILFERMAKSVNRPNNSLACS